MSQNLPLLSIRLRRLMPPEPTQEQLCDVEGDLASVVTVEAQGRFGDRYWGGPLAL